MAEPVGRVEISFVDPIKNYYAQGAQCGFMLCYVISNIWVNYVCFSCAMLPLNFVTRAQLQTYSYS